MTNMSEYHCFKEGCDNKVTNGFRHRAVYEWQIHPEYHSCEVHIPEARSHGNNIVRDREIAIKDSLLLDFQACSDCKGSGKYVGFNTMSPCDSCVGTGMAYFNGVEHMRWKNIVLLRSERAIIHALLYMEKVNPEEGSPFWTDGKIPLDLDLLQEIEIAQARDGRKAAVWAMDPHIYDRLMEQIEGCT